MTSLVLIAILLQGVFGSLQGSVVICLGGGHEHEVIEAIEPAQACAAGCTHHHDPHPHPHPHPSHHHPTTPVEHDHDSGCCQCTDIEIGLLVLQSTPRDDATAIDFLEDPAPSTVERILKQDFHVLRGPPFIRTHDPGISHRLSIVRTTRLLV